VYDSLVPIINFNSDAVLEYMFNFVKDAHEYHFNTPLPQEWSICTPGRDVFDKPFVTPIQSNGMDCGFFMIEFIVRLSRN